MFNTPNIAISGELDHSARFSALPISKVLKIRMRDLSLSNRDLQLAMDYPQPNVIAMMRTGKMRLPAAKAVIADKLLDVDPNFLLGKAISEQNPELWDTIESQLGGQLLSENELSLIRFVRKALNGHDVNLPQSSAFVKAVEPLLNKIFEREAALAEAAIKRVDL